MLDAKLRQLTAATLSAGNPRLEALSSDVERVRMAIDCIHDMAVGLPDDVRGALDRIEALAALAADRLQVIAADLEVLAQPAVSANTNAR